MTAQLPLAYAAERYFEASWSLSPASAGRNGRVNAGLALTALRTLAQRGDLIGMRAAARLGPREISEIHMEN